VPPPSDWYPPPSAASFYDLSLTVTDQDGKVVPLDVFRGHPVLITMFYATCPNACPLLTTDIKKVDKQLSAAARERVRVLMVSFDAARDTPARLTQFVTDHGLDAARWKVTAAAEEPARDLAAALGIRVRKLDNGEYFHSSAIILLDEAGKFVTRVEGLGKDPAPILAALR
jgi:protein SCO1/2